MMKLNSFASRVSLGIFTIIVILCTIVGFNIGQHISINGYSKQSFNHDVPATQLSLSIKYQLAQTLEALRGWSSIGDESMKQEFINAWQEISRHKKELAYISEQSSIENHSDLSSQFNALSEKLNQLEAAQQKVLNIAQTPDNFPGIQLLNLEVSPKVKQLVSLTTQLIELESAKPPAQQNFNVLKQMADFRASLATSVSNIRIYLLSSNEAYRVRYQALWHENLISLNRLTNLENQLSPLQKQILAEIKSYREQYSPLPQKLIALRMSDGWDIALKGLNENVAPLVKDIREQIDKIYLSNDKQMKSNMAKIARSQEFAYDFSIISLIAAIIFGLIMTYLLTRMITKPIDQVLTIANSISKGNFNVDTEIKGAHEVKLLSSALSNMLHMLRKVASHAQAVAQGDYANKFIPSSNEDQLGKAIQRMSENLADTTYHNELKSWSSKGIAEFNYALQGLTQIEDLLPQMMNFIGEYFHTKVAAIFLLDGNTLKLSASYAFKYRNSNDTEYFIGDGLVGQAAQERKTIIFSHPNQEENPLEINTGISTSQPNIVVVSPLINQQKSANDLVGVFVLGLDDALNQTQIETLEVMAQNAAVTIEMAQSRIKLEELLRESQSQAEELQTQQEELKVANEELEQQTQMLKETQTEQQQQSENLAKNNLELKEKSKLLEQQKQILEQKNNEVERAKREVEDKAHEVAQASKYKSEFLANMSHELRTPLNSLLILSETLIDNNEQNLTEEQIEDLKIIHGGGNKLLTLINDILDLAKVESGKLSIIQETFNLNRFIDSLQTQFTPVAEQKKLLFYCSVDEEMPSAFYSDQQRLEQILRNLISNALKFTEQGSVELTINATEDQQHLAHLSKQNSNTIERAILFSVKDTGIGIAAEAQKGIFEAFQQADGSTSRKYGGTGLGLTISKELAQLLGGYICFSSSPGQGSTFSLCLPFTEGRGTNHSLVVEQADNLDNELDEVFVADDRHQIHSHEINLVLIVDDDPSFVKSVIKIAHERGYKCLAANQGKAALGLINKYPVSSVILDLGLPDMNGMKVLEGLKASPDTRDIPVHIISASDADPGVIDMGAIGFLSKPVNSTSLLQVFTQFKKHLSHELKEVLLVEDDQDNCHALKKLLSTHDIKVTSTGYGRQASEFLDENQFDCVILDLTLNDMNGLQWLENCEQQGLQLPPVIIYTGEQISDEKYKQLLRFTNSIIIKGNQSAERLFDEIVLFLSSTGANTSTPGTKQIPTQDNDNMDGKKVMLVDDDLRNTYALSKVLKASGLDIIIADNGQMAVDKLAQEQDVDLILMDIMMPVMDGYQAIKEIRKKYQHHYPIIALTAKAMTDDRAHCMNAGANDYLTKPVASEKLMEMVRLWLHQ